MTTRTTSMSILVIYALMALFAVYFAYSAVQGPSGMFQRAELEREVVALTAKRDEIADEVAQLKNLNRRLSDGYLDLDLLDQQARSVLGLIRVDEVVLR